MLPGGSANRPPAGVMGAIGSSAAARSAFELLLIVLVALAVFAVGAFTEMNERVTSILQGYEYLQIDELPLALLTFSLGLAWFAWRRWRELGVELQHRLEIEDALQVKQAEFRDLAWRITQTQETERRLLAHELHDELGQSLNAIKIEAVGIRNHSHGTQPEIHRGALAVIQLTDRIYDVVRDMTARLRPVALDELGLVGALESDLIRWRKLMPGTEFLGIFRNVPESLDELVAMALYRVVQEGVTNILRHSGATQVTITLESLGPPPDLRLSLRDNGYGADLGAIRRGLGLLGMRERVAGLGGDFTVVSQPGAGFAINVTIPLSGRSLAGICL